MKYYKGYNPNVDYSVVQPAPGHGKALNFWAPSVEDASGGIPQPFPSAFLMGTVSKSEEYPDMDDDITKAFLPMLTTREILMLQFMNSVTDRPDWQTQVFDEDAVSKWREDMAEELFDYCIQELRHKATGIYKDPTAPVVAYNGDVLKVDLPTLKSALQDAVKQLEDVPDWQKDRCGAVLNLVDPSLFPLVYDKTRALKVGSKVVGVKDSVTRCGEGEVLVKPDERLDENSCWNLEPISLRFQWLPCDVNIEGDRARIASYINNLHPKHTALYQVVEDVINIAILQWQRSLAPLYGDFTWSEPQFFKRIPMLKQVTSAHGVIVQPVPCEFKPSVFDKEVPKLLNFRELYGKGGKPLQVIVKLFNIELTPENAQYEGEPLHIEGKQNEFICATTMYCYSSSNIKTPRLALRQLVDGSHFYQDFEYEPGEHDFLQEYFGCQMSTGGVQDVGTVELREGRMATFPNLLLHTLQPFELEDASREGHLKILQVSLVEPLVRVVGTADVPAQQRHWWREALEMSALASHNVQGISRLPAELKDRVFDSVDKFPISLEEAKVLRTELLAERERYVKEHASTVESCNSFYLE